MPAGSVPAHAVHGGGAPVVPAPPVADWAALRLLNQFRLFVAVALATVYYAADRATLLGSRDPVLFEVAHLGWLVCGLGFIQLIRTRRPSVQNQLYLQSYADLVCVVTLMYASGGIGSGLSPLLVIGMALIGQLIPSRQSLLFAAIASLVLLSEGLLSRYLHGPDGADLERTALVGASLFTVAWLMGGPVRRLSARHLTVPTRFRSGLDVQQVAQLNEEIVQELDSGVLVIDANRDVHVINDAARVLLGAEFTGLPIALSRLCPMLAQDLGSHRQSPGLGCRALEIGRAGLTVLPRYTPLSRGGTLVRLDDHTHILQQFQQLKLASLGRLSASIAHEIRNPLGAISHAVQLLEEADTLSASDRELLQVARRQSLRIDRIVSGVLEVSNRPAVQPSPLDLAAVLDDFRLRFLAERRLPPDRMRCSADAGARALFDAGQLDQVLWNLCNNALLHNAGKSITITLCAWLDDRSGVVLDIVDDGAGVPDELVDRLFEPFFSTSEEGTGLGLYIVRELCAANRASIACEPRRDGGQFRITLSGVRGMAA